MKTMGIFFGKDAKLQYIVRRVDGRGNLIYEKEFDDLMSAVKDWNGDGGIVLSINDGEMIVPLHYDSLEYPYIVKISEGVASNIKNFVCLNNEREINIRLDWLSGLKFKGYYEGSEFAILEKAANDGGLIRVRFDTIGVKNVVIISTERQRAVRNVKGDVLNAILYVEGIIVDGVDD